MPDIGQNTSCSLALENELALLSDTSQHRIIAATCVLHHSISAPRVLGQYRWQQSLAGNYIKSFKWDEFIHLVNISARAVSGESPCTASPLILPGAAGVRLSSVKGWVATCMTETPLHSFKCIFKAAAFREVCRRLHSLHDNHETFK